MSWAWNGAALDFGFDFTPRPHWKAAATRAVALVQDLRTGEVLRALACGS